MSLQSCSPSVVHEMSLKPYQEMKTFSQTAQPGEPVYPQLCTPPSPHVVEPEDEPPELEPELEPEPAPPLDEPELEPELEPEPAPPLDEPELEPEPAPPRDEPELDPDPDPLDPLPEPPVLPEPEHAANAATAKREANVETPPTSPRPPIADLRS